MELISTKVKSRILNNNILKSFSTKSTVENMIITWFYEHEVLRNINNNSNAEFLFNGWEPLHLFLIRPFYKNKSFGFGKKKDRLGTKPGFVFHKT